MEISLSCNSLLQLQSELGTSCSGLSEQDCFGSGLGFKNYTAFDRFTLLRELNSGATATVYEAFERRSTTTERSGNKHVALKILNSRPGGGYVLPANIIQQEIDCAKRLQSHPNIANLLDVVAHEGHLALAFELVRGHDLLEHIKHCRHRVPEQLCLHYFKQLLSAVRHMHSRGIAHRDLKPENCMIDPLDHTLKVIDFGLAAPIEAQLPLGCGTLNTIAPECIVQEGKPVAQDPVAVDVWGLGVTLYITLAGRFPFQDERRPNNDQQQVYNTLKGRLNSFPQEISPAARDLVQTMLQTNPSKRPSLDQIANHPWLKQGPQTAAFHGEGADGASISNMYPYSPASDSANSDQTSEHSHSEAPWADNLTFILERYLTNSGMEKPPRPPSQARLAGADLREKVNKAKPRHKQKPATPALQPEVIQAARMPDSHPHEAPTTAARMAAGVASECPQVVSVFTDMAQSWDYSFDMPGQGDVPPDDTNMGFGLPMDDERSWQSDRAAVKLFTLSHEDIGQTPSSSSLSSPTTTAIEGLETGRMSCNQFHRLPSVPEASEEDEARESGCISPSAFHAESVLDFRNSTGSHSNQSAESRARLPPKRPASSQDLQRVPPLGPRLERKTASDSLTIQLPSFWQ